MSIHLFREVDQIKRKLLALSAVVEDQVRQSVKAFEQRDLDRAEEAIRLDASIDRAEVEIEEECLKILALHQPVAGDLRFIVAVLKINNDLERIGDLAVNIARKAVALATQPDLELPFSMVGMSEKAQSMLRDSLDSLVNLDPALASDVCRRDDEVDLMKRKIRRQVESLIQANPERIALFLKVLAVSRNLERIGDLATNVAEDVIYTAQGRIVRHGGDVSSADDATDNIDGE
ncbi:MAG: phosphate signaling complex protein PhoU [Pirellulales bacterium]|nr:phosphate signaling complex protein PhoU [Pirellulales bacterium]